MKHVKMTDHEISKFAFDHNCKPALPLNNSSHYYTKESCYGPSRLVMVIIYNDENCSKIVLIDDEQSF